MNKTYTLILITLFYIIAFWIGVMAILVLKESVGMLANMFIGTTISTFIIYLINIFLKNASIYDPYWSVQPIFLIFTYYFVYKDSINFSMLHLVILIPLIFWAVRLTTNWGFEFTGLDYEDWRYRQIKASVKNKGIRELAVFVGFMYIPTIVVYFTVVPLFNSFIFKGSNQLLFYIMGAIITTLGVVLEMLADNQMANFRQKKLGTNIDEGLWKYSRHPNYLGELLVWTGLFIAAFNNFKWINIVGIILVYALFIFISIPLAEKRYLQKYPGYLEYKKRTSMLMLLPKKQFENKKNA